MCPVQQDPEKRGAETHERCGTLGPREGDGRGLLGAHFGHRGRRQGALPTFRKDPLGQSPPRLPPPPQHPVCPVCPGPGPVPIDEGADPGLASRAAANPSGPRQAVSQPPRRGHLCRRMLGKSMLGNSRRSPHRYNQVWWKLKAIRNRAGFISISNNTHRNGECADGK